jgi:hypothetical protein
VRALSQAMSNHLRQSTWILDRRRCLGRVREWSNTISYTKRCSRQDWLSSEGQRFKIEFKNKKKQQAGMAWSRKRKIIQSVNVAAVHELKDVSSDEDTGQRTDWINVRK